MQTVIDRRRPRWSTRLPVRYQVFDGRSGTLELGSLTAARARDLGERGMFLQQVALPVGTRLHLFFELPESWGGCVEAFGEVVHARPRLDVMGNEIAGVGVRFSWMSAHDRARLEAYLRERRSIDAACLSAAEVRRRAEERRRGRLLAGSVTSGDNCCRHP